MEIMEQQNKGPVLLWYIIQEILHPTEFEQLRNRVMSDEQLIEWWKQKIGITGSIGLVGFRGQQGKVDNVGKGGILDWHFVNPDTGIIRSSGIPAANELLSVERKKNSEIMSGELTIARMIMELRRTLTVHPIRPKKKKHEDQLQLF